ncbi:MAG: ABC transporter permease, partial [Oscillospiraceae bacterium]
MKSKTGSLGQRMYLLRLLVKRNIKNQYYRSFIGVLWTVLNPLLNMAVMAFVFSQLFGRHTDGLDYPIYL